MSEIFKAAVIPAARVLFGTPRMIDKVADLVGEAASDGAKLVVLPEAFVGGYPQGDGFRRAAWLARPQRVRGIPALL